MKKQKQNETESKPQYVTLFMSVGLSVGLAIGAAVDNMPLCMSIGLCVGSALGALIDFQNRKQAQEAEKTKKKKK